MVRAGSANIARLRSFVWVLLVGALAVLVTPPASATIPPGFRDTVVFSGRVNPTSLTFAPNGRVLVTEKSGLIWAYSGLGDSSPTQVADLRAQVDDYWDRGLLGLAVPPNYPTDNHLYVLYTYDAAIGGTAPRWSDACPNPPGATTDGCVVSGRLSRLTLSGGASIGEQVLINDWCQQFPSHSVGTLAFGADGYLYASAGEGASFNAADYGQFGATNPGGQANPCGDPPGSAGTALTSPTAQGGSLRSQSPRRPNGPTSLDGAILRLDPATGLGAPGNPFAGSSDVNKARILAYGLRNPFRFALRPGTRELWTGDVGQGTWEEINRVVDTGSGVAQNFGWPCYEGPSAQPGFQSANLDQCTSLYNSPGAVSAPYYSYNHGSSVVTGDGCSTANGSSVTGAVFYPGGQYPSAYTGALFFADHTRRCVWAMLPDAGGQPSPSNIVPFTPAANPVDLKIGPNNDLFYVDLDGGTIHRITYAAGNQPPTAHLSATPTSGGLPLTVQFDGSASSDPEGAALRHTWSFGDGTTGTGPTTSHVYGTAGTYTATLTVTDPGGLQSTSSTTITAGDRPPTITSSTVKVLDRDTRAVRARYRVGDVVSFRGTAQDGLGQPLPASAYSWRLVVNHGSHAHDGGAVSGRRTGTFSAPDHSYPCYLTVVLTVTDSLTGLKATNNVRVDPQTVALTFKTSPAGLKLSLGSDLGAAITPFTVTVVVRHNTSVSAPVSQTIKSGTYSWQSWSDGETANHTFVAPAAATTYTATYRKK
jgi:glucose/arabinose dehydrogenase